jgi:hypothetical protein
MFDRPNDPADLQLGLESFIQQWYGSRLPWYGISTDKLDQTRLPQPLKWLYGYCGAWPSDSWHSTLLGGKDMLMPFECLQVEAGKLVFARECQNGWQAGVEREGKDPPAWMRRDNGPWVLLDQSLTRFLVTFVLYNTVYQCDYQARTDAARTMRQHFDDAGIQTTPLWLEKPYPIGLDAPRPLSFYTATCGARFLIQDGDQGHCGTNADMQRQEIADLPVKLESGGHLWDRRQPTRSLPFPDDDAIPSMIRKHRLEMLIRRHNDELQYHQARLEQYRHMLQSTPEDGWGSE